MSQAFAPVRPAAPAIASNDAAISPDLVQLHLLAVNGLAEALHVLRNSDCNATDLHHALGRARRGLTNIKRMVAMEGVAA